MVKFLEELKTKNDIVSVVSRYVPLERRGRAFWGRCPFHHEKTPSFVVNDEGQFYHCFGCGVGGDVIKFVQEIESLDFMGAVNMLADMAHIEVPSFSGFTEEGNIQARKKEKDRLLALLRDTALHYVENLKNPEAKNGISYLEKRKISPQIARRFGLGFSLNFNDIILHLKSKGYTLDEMQKAGVIKFKDDRPYDAIGGRVVFPIIDTSNNVIAFCGRTLESHPDRAKYLNTADTPVFSKSKNLYALNLVKKEKMQNGNKVGPLIVVEGQMDVVSLHKAGFTTAVASMGTSLTSEQAKLLKRFTDKVYICYDGDIAGQKATLRGLDILKEHGLDVYVMTMPEGLDPDDVINKYGAEGYKKLMDKALPLADFKFEFLKKGHDLTTSEGRSKYLTEAIEILKTLSDVEREVYIDKVSEIASVMKDFVRRQLSSEAAAVESPAPKTGVLTAETKPVRQKAPTDAKVVQAEKFILSSMLYKKPYAFFRNDISEYFTDNRADFYKTIVDLDQKVGEKELPQAFYEKYAAYVDENEGASGGLDEEASEIINYIYRNTDGGNDENYFKDCVYLIYKAKAEREIEQITRQLEIEPDKERRQELLNKMKELITNIKSKKVDL